MNNMFQFKQFEVSHTRSSMKVGADAVLLGSWARSKGEEILDIGTGCGIIALMLAQRFPSAILTAIDCDKESVAEAKENFERSPWRERLQVMKSQFPDICKEKAQKYDLVVSNPPYFNSGVNTPLTRREKARHQAELSPFSLIENCDELLKTGGCLSMIYPIEYHEDIMKKGAENGFKSLRICKIRNNLNRPVRRIMIEFGRMSDYPDERTSEDILVMFENQMPTKEYLKLCKEFYLKF